MATAKELRLLSIEELDKRALDLREKLFRDQLKRRTGQLDKPSERTMKRKELARVLTVRTAAKKAAVTPKAAAK